jgi:hypothetical protein
MGDSVLTTTNTTSNRRQEPDESEHDASSSSDSREVSVGGFHPILTRDNRMDYRIRGVKGFAGFQRVCFVI